MLWGNMALCAKLSGEDLSGYSNKIEPVVLRKCTYYYYTLLRKRYEDSKHFAELVPHHDGKTAGTESNYASVTLCIL